METWTRTYKSLRGFERAQLGLAGVIDLVMGQLDPRACPLEVIVWLGAQVRLIGALDYVEGRPKPLMLRVWTWLPALEQTGRLQVWVVDARGARVEARALAGPVVATFRRGKDAP
jgi:hypothetical protein